MTRHSPQPPRRDPYAEREARKYENPIPSREFIMDLLERRGELMNRSRIAEELGIEGEEQMEALRRRLRAMERDGQLIRNRKGGYGLVSRMDLVCGRVIGHPDGFGFLVPEDGGEDLFLSAREMRGVFHGDRVMARVAGIDRRGRREGSVVEVLERNTQRLVGRYFVEGGVGFVVPDNKRISQDILIAKGEEGGARHDQIVTVEIIEQPTKRSRPLGRIVEVLGEHMAPGMEIEVAIRAHNLPLEWPPQLEREIAHLGEQVPEQAKQGREDLRHLPLVTIDGEDARDFDDAVFCRAEGNGWKLLVAIADVSSYVRPGTALDDEARERGTSVYFPERVIPMLPEVLSNGLCSLNPGVDRLCMVCELAIDASGEVTGYRFFDAVMRSHARLTYTEVAAILVEREESARSRRRDLLSHLEQLYALFQALRKQRERRGAMDFITTETRIVFGPQRKIEQIVPLERNEAHMLIEECMVAANVAAANFLLEHRIPALFRVHEGPTAEKLEALREFLRELGLQLEGGEKPRARHFARLLEQIKDRPDAHLIQTVLLRSMRQAIYTPDNEGHFGLAFDAYAHFTSPIRRYPDLVVHRAIRHVLAGKDGSQLPWSHDDMVLLGEHCSMTERRADDATRDAVDWLKCEYMMDKVGEEYEGVISSVTAFGLFVELQHIYVEGLVHVTALGNDYFHFDPAKHRLTGERTGRSYRLGDGIRVKVVRVDLDERKIDFELAESGKPEKPRKRRRRRR
ncbi:MAG TPA: ribonuclease R [Gammaproteobacteria bacterium]|nr:ribonuclease R [Gammaproteobacteria bacterium]